MNHDRLVTLRDLERAAEAYPGVYRARAVQVRPHQIDVSIQPEEGAPDLLLFKLNAHLHERLPVTMRLALTRAEPRRRRRWPWYVLGAVVVIGFFVLGAVAFAEPGDGSRLPCGGIEAKVVRVIDGDTVDVEPYPGARFRVRMLNLDAPELRDKRAWVRKVARAARRRLAALVSASAGVVQLQPAKGYRCMFRERRVRWKPRVLARLLVLHNEEWVEAASLLVRDGLACPKRKRGVRCAPAAMDSQREPL